MKIWLLLFILLFFSCSLIQPSYLLINNKSDYTTLIKCKDSKKDQLLLEKNKHDYFLVNPGKIILTFQIEEIEFDKDYEININYMENKEFNFDINH